MPSNPMAVPICGQVEPDDPEDLENPCETGEETAQREGEHDEPPGVHPGVAGLRSGSPPRCVSRTQGWSSRGANRQTEPGRMRSAPRC